MKVTKRYNQYRRDLDIDIECQNCGHKEIGIGAYDDLNFWENVVPNFKCEKCGKSTKDLGLDIGDTSTKYPEGYQI